MREGESTVVVYVVTSKDWGVLKATTSPTEAKNCKASYDSFYPSRPRKAKVVRRRVTL